VADLHDRRDVVGVEDGRERREPVDHVVVRRGRLTDTIASLLADEAVLGDGEAEGPTA